MDEVKIITDAFNLVVGINKKANNNREKIKGINDSYDVSVSMANAISNHAVKGKFPKELFQHRSPNQTEKEATYIENNYKQHTLPIFVDYLSTITRPFGDGNWSIKYKEDKAQFKGENSFQEYVEKKLPIYGSLENFIKFVLPSIKTIDANGYIGIRPKYIDYIEDENGEFKVNDTTLFEPTIYYYPSSDLIKKDENYILFLSKEKSSVKTANKLEDVGLIFELYTKESVYFIKQIGNKVDNKFEIVPFYKHDLGYIPCHILMGIPKIENDEILWQSPFLYSVDLLDLALINSNWLQASINKCVFPNVVMYGSPCEFRDSEGHTCTDGSIMIDGITKTCPSCNGSGLKSRLSPLGTLLINPATKFEQGEVNATQDPLRFISPDVTTLEFLKTKIEIDTEKARKILHLQTSNSQVKGTENLTATGLAIDAKSMYSFVKPISDQIFTLYEFCLKVIGEQRYASNFEAPELSYPKNFDFKSPEDYLFDIGEAIKNNLPPSFIQTILLAYVNSLYGDSSETTRIFKLISEADRLFGMSQDEINMKLARGTIAKWEDILHSSIMNFLNELISEDENFLNKDISEQKEALIEKAKAIESSIGSNAVDTLINDLTP